MNYIVAPILDNILSDHIVGINRKKVSASIWSGKVNLTGFALNTERLNLTMKLPFSIEMGKIEQLSISVDWKTFLIRKLPIKIRISGVYIECSPRKECAWFRAFAPQSGNNNYEDVFREIVENNIKEDPALMAIWAPLFESIHVEIENVTVIFKDIIATQTTTTDVDADADVEENAQLNLSEFSAHLDFLRISNPNDDDDDTNSDAADIVSELYNQALKSSDYMETRVKSIEIFGLKVSLHCDSHTARGWFPEHPFCENAKHSNSKNSHADNDLIRLDSGNFLLRVSRRKQSRGFATAIVLSDKSVIHLALTPSQLISIAHFESAMKVWNRRMEYAFARRPLIKDGTNWKQWWRYAKRAVLKASTFKKNLKTPKNLHPVVPRPDSEEDTSQRVSEILQDALSASATASRYVTDSDDEKEYYDEEDDDDDESSDDDDYFTSSSVTGLHLRKRLKKGLIATASIATSLSLKSYEKMHQRRRRRKNVVRSNKIYKHARNRLANEQIKLENNNGGCFDFQITLPKICVRLKENFGENKYVELVYEKVYVCINENSKNGDERAREDDECKSIDLRVVLHTFNASVVSSDEERKILRGENSGPTKESITVEVSEFQKRTSIVIAPIQVALDSVSLDIILQFAVNEVPGNSLFAKRLRATLSPLCEALKLNVISRLQTVEALLEAKEYEKEIYIRLEGLKVCLVDDESREPLVCAGFDRLISTMEGAASTTSDNVDLLVGRETYMRGLFKSAKQAGDNASLSELEGLVGTMRSSFSVENVFIGTDWENLILKEWNAAIISEENTINRTQRVAVPHFDPISITIKATDINALSRLANVLTNKYIKKMDASNWHSDDKLFKASATIAPPIMLDAKVSLPDVEIVFSDTKDDQTVVRSRIEAKLTGITVDAASTSLNNKLIAWTVIKISSAWVRCCEKNSTSVSISDFTISRAERRDKGVYTHVAVREVDLKASLSECIDIAKELSQCAIRSKTKSKHISFQTKYVPSSLSSKITLTDWNLLPNRCHFAFEDVQPCVQFVSRAVVNVGESTAIVAGTLDRFLVSCTLIEHCGNTVDCISLEISKGIQFTNSVSSLNELCVNIDDMNLACFLDGFRLMATASTADVIVSLDFKACAGKFDLVVPWRAAKSSSSLVENVLVVHLDISCANIEDGFKVLLNNASVSAGRSKFSTREALKVSSTSSKLLDAKAAHIANIGHIDEFQIDIESIDVHLTSEYLTIMDSFTTQVINEIDKVCKRVLNEHKQVESLSSSSSSSSLANENGQNLCSNAESVLSGADELAHILPSAIRGIVHRISLRIDDDRYSLEYPVPISSISFFNMDLACVNRHKAASSPLLPHELAVLISCSFGICADAYALSNRTWVPLLKPVKFETHIDTAIRSFVLTSTPIELMLKKSLSESLAVSAAIITRLNLRSSLAEECDSRKIQPFQCFWLKNSSGVDIKYEMITNMDTSLGGTCISYGEVAVRYGDSWKDDATEYLEKGCTSSSSHGSSPSKMIVSNNNKKSSNLQLALTDQPTVIGLKFRLVKAPESRQFLSLENFESRARKCVALPKSVWGGTEGDSCSLVADIGFRESACEQREVMLRSNVVIQNSTLKPIVLSFLGKTFGPIEAGDRKFLPLSFASLDSFLWKFGDEGVFSALPGDKISLDSIDTFLPVNAKRCAIAITSDAELITRTIAFVAPLELRNHLPVPIKASFVSGTRKFSSFVVAPRSTVIVEESEDVLDAATLSFVPLGYVCTRSSIFVPTFSSLAKREKPLRVYRHSSFSNRMSDRKIISERHDEDATTLECSIFLDKKTSSRVVSISCAMTMTNLTAQSLILKYADEKKTTGNGDKFSSLDEFTTQSVVCPPTPPSANKFGSSIRGGDLSFEHFSAAAVSPKAMLLNRLNSISFSSSDMESSFKSTPVRANLSSRFQSPSPNTYASSAGGLSSNFSNNTRFSSPSPYTFSSGSNAQISNSATQYPRILGDSRRHRRNDGYGIFTLGFEEYVSDPFELATSGKSQVIYVRPHFCYVLTAIYDESDEDCAHIFVRPNGTVTNSTDETIAFREPGFEESDGIIVLPGQTAHVRSKPHFNNCEDDNEEEIKKIPYIHIRPATSAHERWNWSNEVTDVSSSCMCSRALSLEKIKDGGVQFSVQFTKSKDDGCFNYDIISKKHVVRDDAADHQEEEKEAFASGGFGDIFHQTFPSPKLLVLRKPSPTSQREEDELVPSSSTFHSPMVLLTKPLFLKKFTISIPSIGLSLGYRNAELAYGKIQSISFVLSEEEDAIDPVVEGSFTIGNIEINKTSIAAVRKRSSELSHVLFKVPSGAEEASFLSTSSEVKNAIELKLVGCIFSRARIGVHASVEIAPICIDLDEDLVKKLPGFLSELVQSCDVLEKPKLETRLKMERNKIKRERRQRQQSSLKKQKDILLFQTLTISDIQIVLSFTDIPFVPFLFSKLAAVEKAKITLNGFKNQRALTFPNEVMKNLEKHAMNQAADRLGDLVKHNALFGDPARLVESTRSAVSELSQGKGFTAIARVSAAFGKSGLTTLNRIKSIADGWVEEFDSIENERRLALRYRRRVSEDDDDDDDNDSKFTTISVINNNNNNNNYNNNEFVSIRQNDDDDDDDAVEVGFYSERFVESVCKAIMGMIQNPLTGLEFKGVIGFLEGSVLGAVSGFSRILGTSIELPLNVLNSFFRRT